MSVVVEQEIPVMQRQILCIEDGKLVVEVNGKTEEVILSTVDFTPVIAVEQKGRRLAISENVLSQADRNTIAEQREKAKIRKVIMTTAYEGSK